MANRRTSESRTSKSRRPAAITPEGRENQMVSLAVQLAEKQLMNGTATSQVIAHYLKLGSSRERLEQERIAQENHLLRAKTEAMASAARVEELYKTALSAMRSYAGQEDSAREDEFDD